MTTSPLAQSAPARGDAQRSLSRPQPVGGSAVGWTAAGGSPVVVADGEHARHALGPLRRPLGRAAHRQRPFQRLRGQERHAHRRARLSRRRPRRRERRDGEGGEKAREGRRRRRTAQVRQEGEGQGEREGRRQADKSDKRRRSRRRRTRKGEAVAKAEPSKPSEAKKPAIDKTPTGNLESGAAQTKAPLTGAQADASGVEPEFRWPARGRIIQGFKAGGNDGINISVPSGTSVRAAESGVVVYSGDGLKGYGNLVLIKHPNGFVTAYGNNGELDVKRGENGQARAGDRQVRRHRQRQFAAAPFRTAQGFDPGRSDELPRRALKLSEATRAGVPPGLRQADLRGLSDAQLILRAADEGGGSKERPAALDFSLPNGEGSDESEAPRPVRRSAHVRALRRVGLQSGRRQAGAARRRADRADGNPLGDRRVCVLAYALASNRRIFKLDGTEAAGALAGALFTAEFIALYESLRFTTAARATVFIYAAPFFVALGAAFLLKDERLRPIQWAGLAVRLRRRRLRHLGRTPGGGAGRRRAGAPGRGALGRDDDRHQGDAAEARRPAQGAALPDRVRGARPRRLRPSLWRAGARRISPRAIAALIWQGVVVVGVSYSAVVLGADALRGGAALGLHLHHRRSSASSRAGS